MTEIHDDTALARAERAESELAKLRANFDLLVEGAHHDTARIATEADALRARVAELCSALETFSVATRRFRDAVADDNVTCRDNGMDGAQAVEDEWQAIDDAISAARAALAEVPRG